MNDYTINNCQTDNEETFKANLFKCIEVLDQHRDNDHAQIVLQMPETMEHSVWNYFIYPDLTAGGYQTSWQEILDLDDIDDYTPEHYATAEEIFAALTPEEGGIAWYDINLMEVTW